jgi:hypothetical protein
MSPKEFKLKFTLHELMIIRDSIHMLNVAGRDVRAVGKMVDKVCTVIDREVQLENERAPKVASSS